MRAWALISWLMLCPALAQLAPETSMLSLRFQANANRLTSEAIGALDRLSGQLRGDNSVQLIVATPLQSDPRRQRLLAARETELRRQFEARALHAEFEADAQSRDDDSWTLQLRPVTLMMPVAAKPMASSVSDPEAKPSPPLWRVEPGPSLRAMLGEWAGQTGWTLVWQSSYDYPVQAPAELHGDFAAMLPLLLGGFSEAKPPPTGRIFVGNRVVIIE